MAKLLYYVTEKVHFPVAFEKKMSIKEAEIVFAKLCRHFKIDPRLEWTSGRNHPMAFGTHLVKLNVDWNNYGVLCHELAHILSNQKYGERVGHCKKHYRIMARMIKYCEKKNWFAEELAKRTAPKPVRPAPTQEEIRLKKMTKLIQDIERYNKKITFYQRKLSKARKSYNLRVAHLKKKEEAEHESN